MSYMHTARTTVLARALLLFAALFTFLFISWGVASADAQLRRHARHARSQADMLALMRDEVKLVEAQPSTKTKRANVARNRNGTYEAFTLEVPIEGNDNNLRDVIFVEDKRKGKIYEVRGFDFPRPFADLAWRGNNTLVFDQWMQPSYAVHYEINVPRGKLVAASSFWDR